MLPSGMSPATFEHSEAPAIEQKPSARQTWPPVQSVGAEHCTEQSRSCGL
jgi:hypothetical protein